MNEIHKAYKFRIYPTGDQQQKLNQTFGCVRFVWNKLVENFNLWTPEYTPEKVNEQTLKQSSDHSWLYDVSNCALQQKIRDFNETKNQFFSKKRKKKLGRMKFKDKKTKQSYRLGKERFKLNQQNKTLKLEKIGHVPVVIDRQIPENANYRSVTVSKTPTGKYFVSILVKETIQTKPLTGKKVGIDLGLKDLYILSDKQTVSNPKWFRENQAKLAKAQKHLNRKQKDSNRYKKQRLKVAKLYEKVSNQRSYFLHNMTTSLVNNYDVICVEDLNVDGMKRNHNLAKSISDAGWASFVSMLEYKCDWYGKTLVKVDRFFPSSKTCSSCGHKEDKMPLNVRQWTCPICDTKHDRDLNAALNILNKGFSDLTG